MTDSVAAGRRPLGLYPGCPDPLYDAVVGQLRAGHYSRRTDEAYVHWIRRFCAM